MAAFRTGARGVGDRLAAVLDAHGQARIAAAGTRGDEAQGGVAHAFHPGTRVVDARVPRQRPLQHRRHVGVRLRQPRGRGRHFAGTVSALPRLDRAGAGATGVPRDDASVQRGSAHGRRVALTHVAQSAAAANDAGSRASATLLWFTSARLVPANHTLHVKNSERWTMPYTGRSRCQSQPLKSSALRFARMAHQMIAAINQEKVTSPLTCFKRRHVSASTQGDWYPTISERPKSPWSGCG